MGQGQASAPQTFMETYPNAQYVVVSPENFTEYLATQ